MSNNENKRIHTYYRLSFKLLSPMVIGCGKSENTDNDVLLGSDEKPYIPATSIVGVLRSFVDKGAADKVFGCIIPPKKNDEGMVTEAGDSKNGDDKTVSVESPVIMSDAFTSDETHISERDNVALDEYKVAKDRAKFNYEVIQPGPVFSAIAEITADNADVASDFEKLLAKAACEGIAFGTKTARGLGAVELTACKREFDLKSAAELDLWLKLDPFASDFFDLNAAHIELTCNEPPSMMRIELMLEQAGGLSIRYYTGEVGEENEAAIKNSPLLVRAEAKENEKLTANAYKADPATPSDASVPVVPGTSWAGAFKRRFIELTGDETLADDLFGFVIDESNKKTSDDGNQPASDKAETPKQAKSKISISETPLHCGTPKTLTRIAIDRFSAAVKNGALLTEQSVFYGHGVLTLKIDRTIEPKAASALCAVLCDLNNGYLAVGGETAIGRGLFTIKEMKVDGTELAKIDFNTMKTAVLNGLGKGAAANDA